MTHWKDGHPPDDALSAHLDGETEGSERSTIEDHLRSCAACARLLEDLRRLAEAGAAESPPPVPAQLESRIRWQVRGLARGVARRHSRRPAWLAPFPLAAAASAVVAVGALWVMRHEILPRPDAPATAAARPAEPAPHPTATPLADQTPPPIAAPAPPPAATPAPPAFEAREPHPEPALGSRKDVAVPEGLPVLGRNYQDSLTLAPGMTDARGDAQVRESSRAGPAAAGPVERKQRSVTEGKLSQKMEPALENAGSGLTAQALTAPPEGEADTTNVDARLVGGGRMVMLETEDLSVTVTDRGDVKVRSGRYQCLVRLEGPGGPAAAGGARGGEIVDLLSRAFSRALSDLDDVLPAGSEGALRGAREWRTLSLYDGRGTMVKSISYPIAPAYELPAVVADVQGRILDLLHRRALQVIESACGPAPEALRSIR